MDYHKNAPWTAVSRERLARMVIHDGVRLRSAVIDTPPQDSLCSEPHESRYSGGKGLKLYMPSQCQRFDF